MQNTEDVYTGEETWVDEDTVECIKRITRGASEVGLAAAAAALPIISHHFRMRLTPHSSLSPIASHRSAWHGMLLTTPSRTAAVE